MDFLNNVVFPYFNFVLFLVLAVVFLRKPLASMAASKRENYENLLKEAQAARQEAEKLYNESKARFERLNDDLKKMEQNSKAAAEAEAKSIVESAEKLAAHLKTEAQRIAQGEVAKAKIELTHEIIEKAREAVEQQLSSKLDQKAQAAIISKRLEHLKTMTTKGAQA